MELAGAAERQRGVANPTAGLTVLELRASVVRHRRGMHLVPDTPPLGCTDDGIAASPEPLSTPRRRKDLTHFWLGRRQETCAPSSGSTRRCSPSLHSACWLPAPPTRRPTGRGSRPSDLSPTRPSSSSWTSGPPDP